MLGSASSCASDCLFPASGRRSGVAPGSSRCAWGSAHAPKRSHPLRFSSPMLGRSATAEQKTAFAPRVVAAKIRCFASLDVAWRAEAILIHPNRRSSARRCGHRDPTPGAISRTQRNLPTPPLSPLTPRCRRTTRRRRTNKARTTSTAVRAERPGNRGREQHSRSNRAAELSCARCQSRCSRRTEPRRSRLVRCGCPTPCCRPGGS